MIPACYRVEVRHNIVVAIRRSAEGADEALASDDPLAVSTLLAQNNLANGCLDGDYYFVSFYAAQRFSELCLDYVKNLCERSVDAVTKAPSDGAQDWRNHLVPTPKQPST